MKKNISYFTNAICKIHKVCYIWILFDINFQISHCFHAFRWYSYQQWQKSEVRVVSPMFLGTPFCKTP